MHDFSTRIRTTPVEMTGTLSCEPGSDGSDHQCQLRFVDEATQDAWDVQDVSGLSSIHPRAEKGFRARVQADRSPRFLLGGSYIRINRLEPLAPADSESTLSRKAE